VGYDILCIVRFAPLEVFVPSNGISGDPRDEEPQYNRTEFYADELLQLPHLRILTVRGIISENIVLFQLAKMTARDTYPSLTLIF
jgi:hypothetical protein